MHEHNVIHECMVSDAHTDCIKTISTHPIQINCFLNGTAITNATLGEMLVFEKKLCIKHIDDCRIFGFLLQKDTPLQLQQWRYYT